MLFSGYSVVLCMISSVIANVVLKQEKREEKVFPLKFVSSPRFSTRVYYKSSDHFPPSFHCFALHTVFFFLMYVENGAIGLNVLSFAFS